jgi:hypothetical protein
MTKTFKFRNMRTFGIIVVALSVFVVSCQKDQDLFSQAEELEEKSAQIVVNEISVDNAMADMNYESDFFIGAEGMMTGIQGGGMMHGGGMNWGSNNSMHYMTGQHPEYSMHGYQGQYPDSLVMDYGMGTQLNNGRVMSGSMIIHTSEEPNGEGFTRKITYDGFSVDSMSISGMTTIHISGAHQNGGIHSVTGDIMITMPDGSTIHRESEIVREWIEGAETNLDQTDDVMQVTGHVTNTITENGTETIYRKDIVEPLIKPSGCRYFTQGVIELSQGGNVVATLDYGNGDCDDVAIVAKNGEDPVEIILSENDHCAGNQVNGMGMGHSNQHGNETGTNHDNGNGTGNGNGMGQGHGTGHGNG